MAMNKARPRVVIVQAMVRTYRTAFLESLRQQLDRHGIDLDLVYSRTVDPNSVGATADLPWAIVVDEKRFLKGHLEVTWQPCLGVVRGADLVIVEQATRRLLNYVLLLWQVVGGPRVAFWGHGGSFQAATTLAGAGSVLKRMITLRSHWFFAYNQLSAEVLAGFGYDPGRITVVGNSIDTRSLEAARDRITDEQVEALRGRLGIRGRNVGIFCGSLYQEKRIPFLVQAVDEIRAQVPDFEFICVGDGVDRSVAEAAAADRDWFHFVGRQFGEDLACHFALARLFLLPGLVGLAVLDSFVLGVPIVTTRDALHSPEIAYLQTGVNGVIVPGDGSDGGYVGEIAALLQDDQRRQELVEGCLSSAASHSSEAMAERFSEGVLEALDTD